MPAPRAESCSDCILLDLVTVQLAFEGPASAAYTSFDRSAFL